MAAPLSKLWRQARRLWSSPAEPERELRVVRLRALKRSDFHEKDPDHWWVPFVGRPAVELSDGTLLFSVTTEDQAKPAELYWLDGEDQCVAPIGVPSEAA